MEIILISSGAKGSVAVSKDGAWQARCLSRRPVLSTVGCGDYLLAGFLKALEDKPSALAALKTAKKVATAKAWGLTETKTWLQARRQIPIKSGLV